MQSTQLYIALGRADVDPKSDPNDPKMPVYRRYKMADGSVSVYVDPDYERRYREHMLNNTQVPSWRDDPTYNLWRRKPAR